MSQLKIGVVGYSTAEFDENEARGTLQRMFSKITDGHSCDPIIVSGLTKLGIPKLAYEIAEQNGWETWGIACKKAESFNQHDVDTKILVGNEWGDETAVFLSKIDVLVRVGGGEQSHHEVNTAKRQNIPTYEYDL